MRNYLYIYIIALIKSSLAGISRVYYIKKNKIFIARKFFFFFSLWNIISPKSQQANMSVAEERVQSLSPNSFKLRQI
jgi:hypothetical protein